MPPTTDQHRATAGDRDGERSGALFRFWGPVMSAEGRAPGRSHRGAGDGWRRRRCGWARRARPAPAVRAGAGRRRRRRGVRSARRAGRRAGRRSARGRAAVAVAARRRPPRRRRSRIVASPSGSAVQPVAAGRRPIEGGQQFVVGRVAAGDQQVVAHGGVEQVRVFGEEACGQAGFRCSAAIAISVVVLPLPLSPTTARRSPAEGRASRRAGRRRAAGSGAVRSSRPPGGDAGPGELDGRGGQCGGGLERRQRQQDQDGQRWSVPPWRGERDARRATAPSTLTPIAAVGAAAPKAAGRPRGPAAAPQSRCRRSASAMHVVETAGHPQLGGVLERQHRRGVAGGMMV